MGLLRLKKESYVAQPCTLQYLNGRHFEMFKAFYPIVKSTKILHPRT